MNKWLQSHDTSPATDAKLAHLSVVPNVIIWSAIRNEQRCSSTSHAGA